MIAQYNTFTDSNNKTEKAKAEIAVCIVWEITGSQNV